MKKSKKRILNVGCGSDTYGTHFIDLYPTRKEVIKCNADKDKFPFPDNYFDEVYSKCLFEHLRNPLHFLKESYRVLKKGGRIVIITDSAGFFGIFGSVHHGGYEKTSFGDEDRHYALFTTNHMKNWLESVGFKRIKVEYFIYEEKILKKHLPFVKLLCMVTKRMCPHIKAIGYKWF